MMDTVSLWMESVQPLVVWWKSASAHFKPFSTVVTMCVSVYLPSNVLQNDFFLKGTYSECRKISARLSLGMKHTPQAVQFMLIPSARLERYLFVCLLFALRLTRALLRIRRHIKRFFPKLNIRLARRKQSYLVILGASLKS